MTAGCGCRWRFLRVRFTSRVAGHEIAVRPDTAPAVHVAGAPSVAPRPAERRCRSVLLGRGWERPPISACLDRRRGGWSRTAPSSPPLRGHSQPAVPCGKATASRDGARPGLARRCRTARWPSGRPTGPPPPRSGARHPSGTDCWCASDPKGTGAGVRKHTRPRTRTRPSDWGVASVKGCAARAARAGMAAPAQDVAAPADKREGRCASPDGQSTHRPVTSFARSSTALIWKGLCQV